MRLEEINGSAELKKLSASEADALCAEIREELIRTVSRTGGHLASNLGVVELTLAIHRVFDLPEDQLVFDVGHQSYVHKLLTGRADRFSTLRTYGGISGFPNREESEYDCFETGHASTSISAALGLARARDYRGKKHHVLAMVGDGALTGGMCYEALNDAGNTKTRLIIILNDNEMSIARNVGALSAYLTRIRVSGKWQNAKKRVKNFRQRPVLGKPIYKLAHGLKTVVKTALVRAKDVGFFEALGFEYFGPIDGHNLTVLENTFREAKNFNGPCVIHVVTKKGYGYDKAEQRPEAFHGTPPFDVNSGERIELPDSPSSGHIMANELAAMAERDDRVVAITAAMPLGTGLDHFAEKRPDRLIDVGIAEEHAVTMAAGLAAGGLRPYFGVYSTFFQRCYDQMIHDVCGQGLSVTFLLDRSGIGGEDGKTHHGLFDFAELLPVPGMTVLAPCDSRELTRMLRWTLTRSGPCAIRYARNGEVLPDSGNDPFVVGKWTMPKQGKDLTLLAVGTMVRIALKAAEILAEAGTDAAVVNCSTLNLPDRELLERIQDKPFFTCEEHMRTGGFGMFMVGYCAREGLRLPEGIFAVPDRFLPHGGHGELMKEAGLDAESVARGVLERLGMRERSGEQ